MDGALVFVYGTLKAGEPNHRLLMDEQTGLARLVAPAVTERRLPLVIASRYNIPYLVDAPGQGHRVRGELYAVDVAKLAWLDRFEGVPRHYERCAESVVRLDAAGGATVAAQAYLLRKPKPFMLRLPMMEEYSSRGPHGLEYRSDESLSGASDIEEVAG
ncbi:gamma-glutamylaminecyclotransferase-like [Pollicipes pollicipes]|uniref:gamma-glutamylaminecyclotransferase-like n=1 Tax=Pollicipes pollicipes TaxID=41117 RepID=UPI0018850670|nr:gamma-glutamylaminecyclotransferase-like [Pollicipes pollicipes]